MADKGLKSFAKQPDQLCFIIIQKNRETCFESFRNISNLFRNKMYFKKNPCIFNSF